MHNYSKNLDLTIDNVNAQLDNANLIKPTGNLNEKIKKIIVIITGSRSGSSLLKTVLSKSKDIAYLSGEEEPYYILTKNAFPWTKSDGFSNIKNKQRLLDLIFSDMGINTQSIDTKQITFDWQKRLLYQFPEMGLYQYENINKFINLFYNNTTSYINSTKEFLNIFINNKRGYYDLFGKDKCEFKESIKIEEPPFVIPTQKRSFTEADVETYPLFFKTPQDCYRIGLFEELFPNAEIKYIHLSRGFAQTVNGLIDGWNSPKGFFAHNMDSQNIELKIKGYSDINSFGKKWWKFDLPENWKEYINEPIEEVCLNQWYSAHNSIFESNIRTMRLKLEDFLINPQEITNDICDYAGISHINIGVLPIVMSTDTPTLYRWKKRENLMLKLSKEDKVKEMMFRLGYSMNSETWL
jgi:hypothetical protein